LAHYTFGSIRNDRVVDQSGNGQALHIPSKTVVLKKNYLSPPWKNFQPDISLLLDVVFNVIGFIPFGFALSGCLEQSFKWPVRSAVPAIFIFCFAVSLSIETIQAWIPTRSSSLLDLILNTLGAGIGIWIYARRMIITSHY
jgi:glycopeptide antibiotics resistance protein